MTRLFSLAVCTSPKIRFSPVVVTPSAITSASPANVLPSSTSTNHSASSSRRSCKRRSSCALARRKRRDTLKRASPNAFGTALAAASYSRHDRPPARPARGEIVRRPARAGAAAPRRSPGAPRTAPPDRAPGATRTTTRSPHRSSACSRRRSSVTPGRGGALMMSSTRRSNGSRGSTRVDCLDRSGIFPQRSMRLSLIGLQ